MLFILQLTNKDILSQEIKIYIFPYFRNHQNSINYWRKGLLISIYVFAEHLRTAYIIVFHFIIKYLTCEVFSIFTATIYFGLAGTDKKTFIFYLILGCGNFWFYLLVLWPSWFLPEKISAKTRTVSVNVL